ncbi:MAG: LPP20 family lipoprotein [Sulfurimonas sp.]|nr:LPP20 family lipoprotein [Sulfurimonas sp.]
MNKIIILTVFSLSALFAQPLWYYKLPNNKSNYIIGYARGLTEKEAKQNALVSISSQISIKIDDEIIQDKSSKNGNYYDSTRIKSSQKTKATLSGYELLKISFVDGRYFVGIGYENIPSIFKFKRKLKKAGIDVPFNNYLKRFELVRKDQHWYIKYQNVMQVLDTKYFHKFFNTVPNKNLTITTNKKHNILYDGDEFYFKVKSAKEGFVSILSVYENGIVSVLMPNVPVSKNSSQNIPDKDFEAIPQAGLLENGVETFDMYVAIYSSKKLILDEFMAADAHVIQDSEKHKNFDILQRFLHNKEYSTLKVVTEPR